MRRSGLSAPRPIRRSRRSTPIWRRWRAGMLAEAQRLSLLGAMGIDIYRLRAAPAPTGVNDPVDAANGGSDVVVVCPRTARTRLDRFSAQLPRALGIAAERVRWCDAEDAVLAAAAAGYIAVGAAAARALGVQLSTMQ